MALVADALFVVDAVVVVVVATGAGAGAAVADVVSDDTSGVQCFSFDCPSC